MVILLVILEEKKFISNLYKFMSNFADISEAPCINQTSLNIKKLIKKLPNSNHFLYSNNQKTREKEDTPFNCI